MKITANVIVGEKNPEPYIWYALTSLVKVVDNYVIVNTGSMQNPNMKEVYKFADICKNRVKLIHYPFTNFAEVRNTALVNSNTEWIWRLDCDECHYEKAMVVKSLIEQPDLVGIRVYFYHFMLDYDHLESIFPKVDVLRIDRSSRYEHPVHEQFYSDYWFKCPKCFHEEIKGYSITGSHYDIPCPECGNGAMEQGVLGSYGDKWTPGIILDSGYAFAHYSYVRPQKETYTKWEQYAVLEGKPDANKKLLAECGGEDKILEHRRDQRKTFEGEHPEVVASYISKLKREGRDRF